MKKVLLAVFLFMLAQFAAPVAAWDDCPFGLENDPYPGECSRYTDTNDDGICDHSQSEPQTNKTEESGEASISDVGGENTEVEVEEEVSQSGSSRNRSYNIAVPFFSTLVLYLSSWFLTKTAIAKKHVFFSLPLFKMVWNSVLVLSAVPSVVFGFYLALRYSWKWLGTSQIDFLYLHVEGSIVFGTLSILHLILRVQQYLAPAKLLRVKTSK